MFWSYVKTIFRSISSSKVYFFINIAGLTIGFTVFTLIMLFVLNEFNYDTFNKRADRIYRVVEIQNPPGARVQQVAITMPELAPALKREFPEIEDAARFIPWSTALCHNGGKRFYEEGLFFADSSIFKIFTFHFVEGSASAAFDGPYSVVIDQSTARKYFGNANPIGKFINIDADLAQSAFQVTGVIQDFPQNSHLHFNMIASLGALERHSELFRGWTSNDVVTYVLLKNGRSSDVVQRELPRFLKANLPQNIWSGLKMYLQPLGSIHLYSGHILYQVNYDKGNIEHVRLFIMIALFVIILACINFINLTTARSAIRTREVGIRKLLGSFHSHLIYQFIGESILLSLIGLLISLPIVEALLPTFNSMMDGRIIVSYNNQWPFLLMLALIAVTVGFIAGVYPAFYLSSFRPVDLLRGRFSSSKKGILLRKALITLQFSIAIGLVTGTGIVVDQMNYIYNKPLGFNQKNLMYIPLRDTESRSKIPLISERLLTDPRILSVSAGELTGSGGTQRAVIIPETNGQSRLIVRESYVDYGYVRTMGMKMAEGRDFSREFPSDSSSVIINETMRKTLGWRNPVGKQIQMGNGEIFSVIGVVKDFNYFSLQNKIDPLVMWLRPNKCQYLVVRVAPQDMGSTTDFIAKTWNYLMPHQPFDYGFLSNYLDSQYGNEVKNEHLLALFSSVALLVACLGLFGLTLYTSEQRTKEIGVRKVLGASVFSIVLMLSKESIKLVMIAGAVAWPTAYFFMTKWLQNFEYKITINAWVFIISGLIVFLTAMLTLSFQAIKAGLSNPVNALRYE
ncbi:MAG: ABC transporter permease [Bacteroidetes bacterium]|nr:ABC transporter permease [Bacteroidota bacterium]